MKDKSISLLFIFVGLGSQNRTAGESGCLARIGPCAVVKSSLVDRVNSACSDA